MNRCNTRFVHLLQNKGLKTKISTKYLYIIYKKNKKPIIRLTKTTKSL